MGILGAMAAMLSQSRAQVARTLIRQANKAKNARTLSCLVQLQPQQGVPALPETRKQSLYARNIFTSRALLSDVSEIECPPFAEGDISWEKAVGDSVEVDEVVCEVETDKTSVPVPSPVSGVVEALLVEDGSTVTPGMKLLKIKVGAGGAPAATPAAAPPPPPAAAAAAPIPVTAPPPG